MLDKTILVFYMNVGNMSQEDVGNYIRRVKKEAQLKDGDEDQVLSIFVPVRDMPTKVECLNVPTILTTEKQQKHFLDRIKFIDKKLDRISSYFNAEAESRNVITEKRI